MINPKAYKTLLIIGLSLFFNISHAYDNAKEKRWAEEVSDSIMIGDTEWLKIGSRKVFSIYTEQTTNKPKGAAIVIHGGGVHPNWDQIIRPIRSQLPDHGWSTLSIQMPVLANDAEYAEYAPLFDDVAPRINAAIKSLQTKGISNIVIIAHSLGAGMTGYYLANKPDKSIKAFVSIGSTGARFKDKDKNFFKSLENIKLPILDIFGSIDLPEVIQSAKIKKQTAKKVGNKGYTQTIVPEANHMFELKDDVLIKYISTWLETYATNKK